jgi:hypothetical protein
MDTEVSGLRGIPWRLSYRTSTLRPDGQPVDILHDFYIPALQRSVRYDRMACVDIALVDETHYARRQNATAGSRAAPEFGYLYGVLQDGLRTRSRSLWLATATPMQLDAVEVSDLLALTRRVGSFQYDPSLDAGLL